MTIDPKTIIENGTKVVEAVQLVKKAVEVIPKSRTSKLHRKADWDPHHSKDRRRSGVKLRLKTGIWLHFHYETGYGDFEIVNDAPEDLARILMKAFIDEGINYQFSGRDSADTLLAPSMIARPAADFAINKWLELAAQSRHASALTDECANHILSTYNVTMIDRRHRPKQESPLGRIGLLIEKAKALCGIYPQNRRQDRNPGPEKDRRKSDVTTRLEYGIWLQFHRKTRLGMYQVLDRPQTEAMIHALLIEGEHYEFAARQTPERAIEPSIFAEPAAASASAKWKELPPQKRKAFILTCHMAEYVLNHYNVRMIDRRAKRQDALAG